jgi:ABC-type lipopolysaccharide export system ATPase subunit
MGEPAVELVNVTKRFAKVIAVDNVSLRIEAGEFFSLLGPSSGHVVDPVLYANYLTMEQRVVIPAYDRAGLEKSSHGELEAHGRALLGYRSIPMDVSILMNEGGGLCCSTEDIPGIS